MWRRWQRTTGSISRSSEVCETIRSEGRAGSRSAEYEREAEEARINLIEFIPADSIIWLYDTAGCLAVMDKEIEKAEIQFNKYLRLPYA